MSRLVFFDLDGTLLEGSVAEIYMKELYQRKIVKASVLVYTYIIYKLTKRFGSNDAVMRLNARVGLRALAGKDSSEIKTLVESTWEDLLLPRLYHYSKDIVEHYFSMGDIPILLTAAPVELAQHIGEYLGFKEIYASVSQIDDNNLYSGRIESLAYGKEKARIAAELAEYFGISMDKTIAYADSKSDIPLLLNVGVPIVVNPDKHLLKRAARNNWDILHFDQSEIKSNASITEKIKALSGKAVSEFFTMPQYTFFIHLFQKIKNELPLGA
jgi:HAD superfamily hydrolase (TIGR01490 family)